VTVFWRPWAPNAPRATEMKPLSLANRRGSKEEKNEEKDQTSLTYEFVRDCQLTWVILSSQKEKAMRKKGTLP